MSEDLWMRAYLQLVDESGYEPSLRRIEKRMRRISRTSASRNKKKSDTDTTGDIRKKVGSFLRRVGLYNTVKRVMRPAERILHDHRAVRFYERFVKENDLCFDIGANRGSRTEVFLRLGAHVVSVEPLDENLKVLRNKFGANPNVILVAKGLASEEGQREIHFTEKATDVASMSDEWIEVAKSLERLRDPAYSWDQTKLISVTTLDKLIKLYGIPCFCKIDVEGYEYEVLRGLARPVPALSIECTPGYIEKSIDCVKHLASLGRYQFNYSVGESLRMVSDNWVDARAMEGVLESPSSITYPGDIYAVLRPA